MKSNTNSSNVGGGGLKVNLSVSLKLTFKIQASNGAPSSAAPVPPLSPPSWRSMG